MSPHEANAADHSALLAEISWLRRLARELVVDRDLAEDLAQEACAVALRKAPREPGKLRAWLAGVLRQALRQHARTDARRVTREALAARAEAQESTERMVERLALQRELVGAVHELAEPYRSTVLLRFFEELPPREIARRTGVPVATVDSRLQRALAELRERLDRENRTWGALLLPWVQGLEPLGRPALVGLLMKTQLTVAALATLVVAGAFLWWRNAPGEARAEKAELAPPLSVLPTEDGRALAPLGEPAPDAAREALSVPERARPAESAPAAPEPALWTVRARVLDTEARGLGGIELVATGTVEVLATSGPGGWCAIETTSEQLVLEAVGPRWVTVRAGSVRRASSLDPVVVVAPAVALSGVVRNEARRPLASASLRLALPRGFDTRFEQVLDGTCTLEWTARTDGAGAFLLERVPAVEGALLQASAAGYQPEAQPEPLAPSNTLEFVLYRPHLPLVGVLRGTVVNARGDLVAEARVGLGLASVLCDERGDFELDLARAVTSDTLTVVKAGYLPARVARPEEPREQETGWPEHVLVALGGPALSIRGVLLDHQEKPLAGARVWLHDASPAAPVGRFPIQLEALAAGESVPAAAIESESALPEEDGDGFWKSMALADSETSAVWSWVESDGDGVFEIGGLEERSYRLEILRPETLEIVTSEAIRAGARDARVVLPPPDVFERVAGRLLSERGDPLPGVRVQVSRPLFAVETRVFGGRSHVSRVRHGERTTTDAEGRFAFANVPRQGASVAAFADEIIPGSADVTGPEVELRVDLRCHLEVELRPPTQRYDALSVADGDGRGLNVFVLTDGNMYSWSEVALHEGRSGVVSVSSRARQLLLYKAGVLVTTQPIDLAPGQVNRFEP